MPQFDRVKGARKSRWPVVVLVVAAVSAASLALGLLVVGPMMQRRIETPPAALSTSGTTSVTPVHLTVPEADVRISERIIRRPAPRPVPPPVTDTLNVPLSSPPGDDIPQGLRSAAPTPARPAIRATVTDADRGGAAGDSMAAEPSRSASRQPASRTASDGTSGEAGSRETVRAQDGGVRPRPSSVPKAAPRRASPLDALPALDADGAESIAAPAGQSAPTAPDREAPPGGRNYRVQVGRFEDEGAAAKLRDELKKEGLSPRVVRTEREGKVTFRVQVGTFRQRENADRQMEKLKSKSYDPYLSDEAP